MSGRAIILVVVGIIIAAGVVLYNIAAASTNIIANFTRAYNRQISYNIAQSGVNMALHRLSVDRNWRAGFPLMDMLGGKVRVTVFDTTFAGVECVGVRARGFASHNTSLESRTISTAFAYFPPEFVPVSLRGLVTLNGPNQINGSITIDSRNYDSLGNIVPGQGTAAIWTTSPTFTPQGGAYRLGGTDAGIDYVPSNPGNPAVIKTNQSPPDGFPRTPDSALGGPITGFSEGTLKALARSGVGGSQFVTNPALLKYPLSGVTYVELPTTSPTNVWTPSTALSGSGILVVRNSATNATLKGANGNFTGIVIADDLTHLHGTITGAVIVLTQTPSGNVLGNGNATIRFSRWAIRAVTGFWVNGKDLRVISWLE